MRADGDASRSNVYTVLALLRIFAANLQRYGQALIAGGADLNTETAEARALFQRLQAALMSIVEACSGRDDLAPVSRAAWTAFSVGLGACAVHSRCRTCLPPVSDSPRTWWCFCP